MNSFKNGLLLSSLLALSTYSLADEPIEVVASFSILGDMVAQIGKDQVVVKSLVGINEDPHVYTPTPREVREVQAADLVIMNGLGFEGWMTRLFEASDYQGISLLAAEGTITDHQDEHAHEKDEHEEHDGHDHDEQAHEEHDGHDHDEQAHEDDDHEAHDGHDHEEHAYEKDDHEGHDGHDHGDVDPHKWHSAQEGRAYFHHITRVLSELMPEHKADFEQREREVLARLAELDRTMLEGLEPIPEAQRVLITVHGGFRYLEEAYGIRMLSPAGLTTAGEVSAHDVANVVRFVRDNQVRAIFAENITDNRLIEQVAREADIPVFGELYSGALSDASGPAATYLDMMTFNYGQVLDALQR